MNVLRAFLLHVDSCVHNNPAIHSKKQESTRLHDVADTALVEKFTLRVKKVHRVSVITSPNFD